MATCVLCPSGAWECGNPPDLCEDRKKSGAAEPNWTKLGTIQYNVFTAKVKGEIVVKIEPA